MRLLKSRVFSSYGGSQRVDNTRVILMLMARRDDERNQLVGGIVALAHQYKRLMGTMLGGFSARLCQTV
jgi:hypothetical protein